MDPTKSVYDLEAGYPNLREFESLYLMGEGLLNMQTALEGISNNILYFGKVFSAEIQPFTLAEANVLRPVQPDPKLQKLVARYNLAKVRRDKHLMRSLEKEITWLTCKV